MKVYHKALVVAGLCMSMAAGLVGCGNTTLDGSKTVATVGEKTITLGEANFLLRYQQAETESYYEQMLGEGFYNKDLMGNGSTYGETVKGDVITQLQEYCILEDKAADYGVALSEEDAAKITEVATAFLDANSAETKAQMTADQATVERVLSLMTIGMRTANAVAAEADVTVTDEEAAQKGFSYVSVSKGSGDEALSDDEIQAAKNQLAAVAASVASGNTMDAAAVEQGLSAYSGNFGQDGAGYDATMIEALNAATEGELTDVIETETTLYLAQLTSEFDEEATASKKESLVQTKQSEYYNEVINGWKESYPLTIEDAVWADVKFNNSYELVTVE